MHIVHITSELAPLAKAGGLGDMIRGLCNVLAEENEVSIFLPFYDVIDRSKLKNLKKIPTTLITYENFNQVENSLFLTSENGINIYLLEPHGEKKYFNRGKIYAEKDDIERFLHFCFASLQFLLKQKKPIDILHLHDWITGACAPLYKERFQPLGLKVGKVITTIHNMCYQGETKGSSFLQMGLPIKNVLTYEKMQDPKKPDHLNLLKGAISYSDALTTVSPTYAREIIDNWGFGLAPFLKHHQGKLKGILNGIDTTFWNPETDPYLEKNYPPDFSQIEKVFSSKKKNSEALSKKTGLKNSAEPLFACITRLTQQKGPDLIRYAINAILKKGGRFILLASTPEEELREEFLKLQHAYKDNPSIFFYFGFNEELAHLTFSAADALIVPSLFEPCGLTQLIAMHYGTVPIAHSVGGLKDTVFDIDEAGVSEVKRNGYTFYSPTKEEILLSIDRAFNHFFHDRNKWLLMVKNGLSANISWRASADAYLDFYHGTFLK